MARGPSGGAADPCAEPKAWGWPGILPGALGWCLLSAALPVPRSGRVALAHPSFLPGRGSWPAAWASRAAGGGAGDSGGIVSPLWSLADWRIRSPRAGQPLGHHNALAVWLRPFSRFSSPVTEDRPWRWVEGWRLPSGCRLAKSDPWPAWLPSAQVLVLPVLSRKEGVSATEEPGRALRSPSSSSGRRLPGRLAPVRIVVGSDLPLRTVGLLAGSGWRERRRGPPRLGAGIDTPDAGCLPGADPGDAADEGVGSCTTPPRWLTSRAAGPACVPGVEASSCAPAGGT